ncbi:MAG: tripartite tricarboxylate transporter substrate binding protein [Hydrogenophaga sp.]|jgi:tripartite-type tricarboxylate transporter receptor subunit TctC|uniref:Bug family tripartite tricarboxylate transporter substrate binding protein n=1 Tax=Hydrogenophaga sp. TaxID=1904254 RepID=UPI001E07968E|nr:tripartite tricarboxylate transporter substrate binding protein [Hydrogenophaga sp.]MBW0168844.1 tripartite tricarboxylate transporter substrate binding protein [Hydrogenophaga sp.]MBW0183386.1 tripartite tricarboxylate transporter substrate binding protein [Hydrogenophaga sp.]
MTQVPLAPATPSRLLGAALLALAASMASSPALAQAWPAKPVTLVVGTPAGGSVDAYGRALADQLAKQTGGTFVVENKGGANGNLSAEQVRTAAADGHTLWLSTQAMFTINPSVYPALKWKQADFRPLAKGIESPLVLVTHPSVPAKTLPELVKWVAANPGKITYASFSPGTPSHFLGFQLNERFKLDMVHVAYKGSAPQITDLLGGQVVLGFTQLQAALPHVQSGKLNAIAVTSKDRTRFLPQVPSLAELGHPDLTSTVWFGLMAPSATPKPVLDQIQAAAVKAQADADYKAKLEAQGFDVPQESGEAFAATIAAETARWARVVKATGFRAND